jgi:hypothetical protein
MTAAVAACGGATGVTSVSTDPGGVNNSAQAPSAELASAVTNLGAGTALSVTLRHGGSERLLARMLRGAGVPLAGVDFAQLAATQLSVETVAPSGKTIGDLDAGDLSASSDLAVRSGTTTYLEVRHVDKTLYLRVDLKDLLAAVGQPGRYTALESKASSLPGFAKAFVAGDWVALPDSTLSLLRSLRGGSLGATATPGPSAGAAPAVRLIAELRTLLTHGVRVTRVSAGTTDRLALTVSARSLVADLRALRPAALGSGARARSGRAPLSTSAAGRLTVRLGAAIREGALSALTVNLGQLTRHPRLSLPLQAVFARTGPAISAPSGAVQVDAVGLLGLFDLFGGQRAGNGLLGGLGGLGGFGGLGGSAGLGGLSG